MKRRTMFWRMVSSSILRRRSRVLIAVLAVAIGATTLSGLATIALEVPAQLAREVRSYGANLVVSPVSGKDSMSAESLETIPSLVPKGALVGSAAFDYEAISVNDRPYVAAGADLESVRAMNPYWYVEGEWPQGPDEVLIGEEIADTIGASVGKRISVVRLEEADERDQSGGAEAKTSVDFTVSGVLKTGGTQDSYMYMTSQAISALTGVEARATVAEYSIAVEGPVLEGVVAAINDSVPGVSAQAVKRLAQSDSGVISMLRSLLVIIAGIVLVLTLIGVSTTMVAIVAERRNEIGLRKALGATSRSIALEFIGEGVLLGLIGGLIGVVLGYGLASGISYNVFHRSISLPPLIALITVLASVAVAVLACLPPVRRAAAVDPALVLRGE